LGNRHRCHRARARTSQIAGELRHVDKWYGNHRVLSDVSVQVRQGEIVELVGRSGSDKTTVLRVLAGPTSSTAHPQPVTRGARIRPC
jgi:ABC-type phosphate/phosphonate transport system ATPase subunit